MFPPDMCVCTHFHACFLPQMLLTERTRAFSLVSTWPPTHSCYFICFSHIPFHEPPLCCPSLTLLSLSHLPGDTRRPSRGRAEIRCRVLQEVPQSKYCFVCQKLCQGKCFRDLGHFPTSSWFIIENKFENFLYICVVFYFLQSGLRPFLFLMYLSIFCLMLHDVFSVFVPSVLSSFLFLDHASCRRVTCRRWTFCSRITEQNSCSIGSPSFTTSQKPLLRTSTLSCCLKPGEMHRHTHTHTPHTDMHKKNKTNHNVGFIM